MAGEIYRFGRKYVGGITLPLGGTTGQALRKNSDNAEDFSWQDIKEIPNGGSVHQLLSKRSSADGDVEWVDLSSVNFVYAMGRTPFAANWLYKDPLGDPLTPDATQLYLIISSGEYYHNFVRWDATNSTYLQISSGSTSGGGAIFSYIVGETPLADDWLSTTEHGIPIEPEEGLLYLVLSEGDYQNVFYRYDEDLEQYVEVIRSVAESIAEHFSTESAYRAGNLCIYDNQLWKFTATHIGEWDPSHVVRTTLANEIPYPLTDADIEEILTDFQNKIPIGYAEIGSVILASTQTLTLNPGDVTFVSLMTNATSQLTVRSSDEQVCTGEIISDDFGLKLKVTGVAGVLSTSTANLFVESSNNGSVKIVVTVEVL